MSAIDDFWWAEKFGWTPDQVDSLEIKRAARLQHVANAVDKGREEKQRAEERRQQARGH